MLADITAHTGQQRSKGTRHAQSELHGMVWQVSSEFACCYHQNLLDCCTSMQSMYAARSRTSFGVRPSSGDGARSSPSARLVSGRGSDLSLERDQQHVVDPTGPTAPERSVGAITCLLACEPQVFVPELQLFSPWYSSATAGTLQLKGQPTGKRNRRPLSSPA